MKTTIYLVRHSKPMKAKYLYSSDDLQVQNEKQVLSIEGERIAEEKFKNNEFNNIDILFSSNYVRAISTAKYLADKNDLDINVIDDFGERKFGITSWDQLPSDFGEHQFQDENYKMENGESQKEVRERMYNALMKILNKNKGKRIAIVGHSTAPAFLLGKWCEISYADDYKFNGKVFFNGKWEYCQTFKLTFEDQELIDIKVID